jgi:succinyl-CoA synthetase beta subunit
MSAMLDRQIKEILTLSKKNGWVLEPDAKRLFALSGMEIPKYCWAKTADEALQFAKKVGYPAVAKVISPQVIHKSDVGGVVTGIADEKVLTEAFKRFKSIKGFSGMLVEESLSGFELIVGAKKDYQFGPVILLGIGGTGVEIYRDTVLRMAPLKSADIDSMIKGLKAHRLLEGYRGVEPINLQSLKLLLALFSDLVMEVENYFESIDLNPVMCNPQKCVIADARIMLQS